MAVDLESVKHLRRRHVLPHSVLADPDFIWRLDALGLAPWEVVTSRELAAVCGVSPQTLADWRYMLGHLMHLPQPETASLFKGNVCYYRIDVIRDWYLNGGTQPTDRSQLWKEAADHLASIGAGRPQDARQTDELLNKLWHHSILHLRVVPRREPYLPYSGRHNGKDQGRHRGDT